MPRPIRVLCVDDNPMVAEALEVKLSLEEGLEWVGWLPAADALVEAARTAIPDVVLLDLDMPGKDPFETLRSLGSLSDPPRVLIFSGHVRAGLVDRAIDAGAWGYVSKSDSSRELVAAIRRVARGEFAMGSDVEAEYGR